MSSQFQQNGREAKRAAFTQSGRNPKRRKSLVLAGLLAGLLAAVGLFSYTGFKAVPEPRVVGAAVSIPMADVDSGEAKFFHYKSTENKDIRFFVLKSSDGKFRAALDSCDVCFRAKQGYEQRGDNMICRKCGQAFPSNRITDVSGGCNPVGLAHSIEDGKLVIQARELERGAAFF